jgi:hypothetical protein
MLGTAPDEIAAVLTVAVAVSFLVAKSTIGYSILYVIMSFI